MIIVDDAMLARFREKPFCECCGSTWMSGPHHWRSRGAGRLDVAINLIALCVHCHFGTHNGGAPTKDDLLALIALRERRSPENIEDELNLLLRTPGKVVNGRKLK